MTDSKPREKNPVLMVTLRPPGTSPDARVQARQASKFRRANEEFQKRLLSFNYEASLDEAPVVKLTLENTDLFWIDDVTGGADALIEGTFVDFQFGYLDANDPSKDQLSFLRTHTIVGKPDISMNEIKVKAASELQNVLGATISPQWATKSKASDIVRKILADAGYDKFHRQIQDTVFETETIAITSQETILQFIYRLAKPYNFRFYITPGDDGNPVAHFHKPGWTPSTATDDAPRQLSPTERDTANLVARNLFGFGIATLAPSTPANLLAPVAPIAEDGSFGTLGNGNNIAPRGVIKYRPDPPEDSDVLKFSIKLEPDGTPATLQTVGVDTKDGRLTYFDKGEADKDEKPLAKRTFYANNTLATPMLNLALGTFVGLPTNIAETIGQPVAELPDEDNPVKETDIRKDQELYVEFRRRFGIAPRALALVANTGKRAEEHNKALLEQAQSEMVTIKMDLVGIPSMDAGDLWKIQGLRKYSGTYLAKKVSHAYSPSSGYKTIATFTSDGVNAKQAAQTTRKLRDEKDLSVAFLRRHGSARALSVVRADGTTTTASGGAVDKEPGEE